MGKIKDLITLFRILMGEMMMLERKDERNKRDKREKFLGFFVVTFVFIPFMLLIGFFTYFLSSELSMRKGAFTFGSLTFLCSCTSILCLVFGFSILLHSMFFSSDTAKLLPLPIPHTRTVLAKYLVCYMAENVMQTLILIAGFAGYVLTVRPDVRAIVTGVTAIITLPVLPLAYCGIISVLLVRYTRLVENRKAAIRFSAVILAALTLFLIIKGTGAGLGGIDSLVKALENGNGGFMRILNIIFPNVYFLNRFGLTGNPLWLLVYLAVSFVSVLLFAVLTKYLYIDALNRITSKSSGKADAYDRDAPVKINSVKAALFKRELRSLYRSPVFLTSCILVNLFWPVLAAFIIKINSSVSELSVTVSGIFEAIPSIRLIFLAAVAGCSLFLSSINSICSSAYSREGKTSFGYIKSIPVSTRSFMAVKLLTGIFISGTFVTIYYIIFAILFKMPLKFFIIGLVLCILSTIAASLIGIYVDAMHPSVLWEEEAHVLRGNLNTFMALVICIMVFFIMTAAAWFVMFRVNMGLFAGAFMMIFVAAWADVIFYFGCFKKGISAVINFH